MALRMSSVRRDFFRPFMAHKFLYLPSGGPRTMRNHWDRRISSCSAFLAKSVLIWIRQTGVQMTILKSAYGRWQSARLANLPNSIGRLTFRAGSGPSRFKRNSPVGSERCGSLQTQTGSTWASVHGMHLHRRYPGGSLSGWFTETFNQAI